MLSFLKPDSILKLLMAAQLLVLPFFICQGQQNERVDSLISELGRARGAGQKLDILVSIVGLYSVDDPERAVQYANAALIEAENSNDDKYRSVIYQLLGSMYESAENLNAAIENYSASLEIYKSLNNKRESAQLYYDLGDVYKKKGLYKLSLENCLKGLEIFEALNDIPGLADIYNCMGSLYKYQGDNNRALEFYNMSLDMNILEADSSGISISYNNIGVVYAIIDNYDLALDYYFRSLETSPFRGDDKNNATTLGNIANILLSQGKSEEAFRYTNESLEMNIRIAYKRGIANQYRTLGRYYDITGEPELAIEYLLRAYELHKELGRLESEKEITEYLSTLYYREGSYIKAYDFHRLFKLYSDSIFNIEKMKNIAQIEQDYILQREAEVHRLKDQKRKILNLLLFIALVLIITIIAFFFYRQKSKVKRKNLELKNIDLEKSQVESELERKQKELAANTIYMVRKNELINDVVGRLSKAKKNLKEENVPVINDIIKDLCADSQDDIWKEFEVRFLQVRREFYENLQARHPDLTPNEKRLSAFLSLDFTTKEITAITKQSPHSINIARTRLRKKLGLANSDISLTAFLAQF